MGKELRISFPLRNQAFPRIQYFEIYKAFIDIITFTSLGSELSIIIPIFLMRKSRLSPFEGSSNRFIFPFCPMEMLGHGVGSPFTGGISPSLNMK